MALDPEESELLSAIADRLIEVDRRLQDVERHEIAVIPGSSLSEWSQEAFNEPGVIDAIISDEALARSTPCKRIQLGDSELVYSKGAVGALNNDQKALYCTEGIEDIQVTPEQAHQQQVFKEAVGICQAEVQDVEVGQRLEPFLKCMTVTAKKRGLSI